MKKISIMLFTTLVIFLMSLLNVYADNTNSFSSPYNIGDTVNVTTVITDEFNNKTVYESKVVIKGLIRGEEAWKKIYQANSYNKKPPEGYEYILAKIYFEIVSSTDNKDFELNHFRFRLISSNNEKYEDAMVVVPTPDLLKNISVGKSIEGWKAFLVKKDDMKPLIVYDLSKDGISGVWFKGYTLNSMSYSDLYIADISTIGGIEQYLKGNYSTFDTTMGKTNFTFKINENKTIIEGYDYWIQVDYDFQFFYDVKYSNQWTSNEKNKTKQELKEFMEKLGKDLVEKLPNKKLYGCYYHWWYKYPYLRVGYEADRYYSWINYNKPKKIVTDEYNTTKPSNFRWWDYTDDKL